MDAFAMRAPSFRAVHEVDVHERQRNRRILYVEKRITKTNIKIKEDWNLQKSGLIGPVKILEN